MKVVENGQEFFCHLYPLGLGGIFHFVKNAIVPLLDQRSGEGLWMLGIRRTILVWAR